MGHFQNLFLLFEIINLYYPVIHNPFCIQLHISVFQAFVLDFGSEVYVWLGRFCSTLTRKNAIDLGLQVFNDGFATSSSINPLNPKIFNKITSENKKKRPPWCLYAKATERSETILFKQKFLDWPDPVNYKKGMTVESKVMSHSVVLPKDREVRNNQQKTLYFFLKILHLKQSRKNESHIQATLSVNFHSTLGV